MYWKQVLNFWLHNDNSSDLVSSSELPQIGTNNIDEVFIGSCMTHFGCTDSKLFKV